MKLIKILIQIIGLCLISFLGNCIADFLAVGIPGSIFGMILLLVLIERRWIPVEKIELGANFLIAELLLFFIPSAIGVIQFQDILQKDWSQLLLVIELSIFAVVLFVGLTTEGIVRYRERKVK